MAQGEIRVLADDRVGQRGLLAEHGLAFWIELNGRSILFDSGQGLVLRHNARQLGIDLDALDSVVVSHGHYDHVGGLPAVLRDGTWLYAHPLAFGPRYARNAGGGVRAIGMPETIELAVCDKAKLIRVEGPMDLDGGLRLTGPIPRLTAYEDTGGPFYTDRQCLCPDELLDDQAAFFATEAGTVVLLGCAHAGLINTLEYIQRLTANRPIHTVIGGLHLLQAGPERLDRTVAELHRFGIARLLPCHCTGLAATARLFNEFPGGCEACGVGTSVRFTV